MNLSAKESHYEKLIKLSLRCIKANEKILLALSGGADSMFLFYFILKFLKKDQFVVVHVDHQIRKESKEDRIFVENLCKKNKILFFYREFNVKKIAKNNKKGLEECARELRYKYFREVKEELNIKHILIAHNKDDLAETIIFNLYRGCFLNGLIGIKKENKDILRPILDISKEEIYNFLKTKKINWKEDYTNKDLNYDRNYIRYKILKPLKEENSNILDIYKNISEDALKLNLDLKKEALSFIKKHDGYIEIETFVTLDPFLQKEIVLSSYERLYKTRNNVFDNRLNEIIKFITFSKTGKIKEFGKKYFLEHVYSKIYFRENKINLERKTKEVLLKIPGEKSWNRIKISSTIVLSQVDFKGVNCYSCYLDKDLIGDALRIRRWKKGDRFIPFGMKGNKKLQDFFIDNKIPKSIRSNIPIITTEDDIIVWVGGLRIDDRYKITKQTKQILKLNIK